MAVICGDFGVNLPFTGNLQEISGLLYLTSTSYQCFVSYQLFMETEA